MTEEENKKRAKDFLSSYSLHKKWLNADRYAKEYFGAPPTGDEVFLEAKLFRVREFVASLPNCPEKLFLHCHYIRSHSVEKCAELMEISTRSAYRLKNRALTLAAEQLAKNGK